MPTVCGSLRKFTVPENRDIQHRHFLITGGTPAKTRNHQTPLTQPYICCGLWRALPHTPTPSSLIVDPQHSRRRSHCGLLTDRGTMRLLDSRTRRFKWFERLQDVQYAILSHVWTIAGDGSHQEQSFQDLLAIQANYPDGSDIPLDEHLLSPKIVNLCRIALADGYDYVWLDTACIDNSSSAELSEAINSMYHWYSQARICYAYLADVSFQTVASSLQSQFMESRWFRRGWTLQELIAPHIVIFLSAEWEVIDTKQNLAVSISTKTGIDVPILTHQQPLASISVAKRMSWAAKRKTRKVEDQAYCLMGIFDVHMPTVYGEGSRAFLRLQEEICKHIDDDSIFAWGQTFEDSSSLTTFLAPSSSAESDGADQVGSATSESSASQQQYLFAPAPSAFSHESCVDLVRISHTELARRLKKKGVAYPIRTVTPIGLRTRLPLIIAKPSRLGPSLCCAVLACKGKDDTLVALLLGPMRPPGDQGVEKRFVVGYEQISSQNSAYDSFPGRIHRHIVSNYFRTVKLSPAQIELASKDIHYDSAYIVARPPGTMGDAFRAREAHEEISMPSQPIDISIAPWCLTLLRAHGFRIVRGSRPFDPIWRPSDIYRLNPNETLHLIIYGGPSIVADVSIRLCDCWPDDRQGYLAVTVADPSASNSLAAPAIQSAPSRQHEPSSPEHVHSWGFRVGFLSVERILKATGGTLECKMRLCLSQRKTTREPRGQNARNGGNAKPRSDLILSVEIEELKLNQVVRDRRARENTDNTAAIGGNVDGGFWAWTVETAGSIIRPWFKGKLSG
ncbi:HET-domain-containing protein [Trametes coccinea BRFM310]|uniref:HET-domain-containing protein n=1 Tax=Trametes coccinea (strain BRFM310) TaxID=1353009 RepID=A0A1Y2ISM7_TRAC3|nr:HET-domain-containing protein [Trametes coccinea BRFM310]